MNPILTVKGLRVSFPDRSGQMRDVVSGLNFSIGAEKVGIVGESGSGKSVTGRSILGLVRSPAKVGADCMDLDGTDLLKATPKQMRAIRGRRISMILQDPKYSLNPMIRLGDQIAEGIAVHASPDRRQSARRVFEMLEAVRIDDPERVAQLYPHEVSGGMAQRVMIAMMLATEPDLLIADEPTSSLDVTVQNQVLSILDDLIRRRRMGMMFISHDLDLVAAFCDRIIIMYAGRIVETCRADELEHVSHPYSRALLSLRPRIDTPRDMLAVVARDAAWAQGDSIDAFA